MIHLILLLNYPRSQTQFSLSTNIIKSISEAGVNDVVMIPTGAIIAYVTLNVGTGPRSIICYYLNGLYYTFWQIVYVFSNELYNIDITNPNGQITNQAENKYII